MKTLRTTTAGAITRFLQQIFVRRDGTTHRLVSGVWGIFGHGNVTGLGQALEEHGDSLPFHQAKNEQSMVHAAIAYAKTRQRLSTFACTSSVGPGATNMITGAATATINRLPVLLLPGDTFAHRRPAPVLQQLEYPGSHDVSVNDCFRPVSKFWDRINRPEQLLTALPEAMRVLADPAETGAVTLCLPEDVQAEAYDFPAHFFEPRIIDIPRATPANEMLAQAAEVLSSAKRPLIVAGGGIHYSDATAALAAFAKGTGIPVAVTQAGKGALLEDNPLALGAIGVTGTLAANRLAEEADVVLTLGTRLSDFTTASKTLFQNPKVRFISINVHAADAAKHGAIPLVGDLRATLPKLRRAASGYSAPKAYAQKIARARSDWDKRWNAMTSPAPSEDGLLYQSEVIRIVNENTDANATVVHAAGGIPGDIHKLWCGKSPKDYHSEYGYSCMGYEIAGALGVKMAAPEREVYALVGDGSYLMLNQELVTACQEGLKITIVLTDNHGFGCIHNLQRSQGGRSFGNEFRLRDPDNARLTGTPVPVDFAANARSLGATTFTATNAGELSDALVAARAERGPVLIYVPVTPESVMEGFAWWEVPPAAVSEIPSVQAARKNYDEKTQTQRFHH
ncbi:3D-(3,5/4)-trihydroxycyclohexane-1,2-dione acylhydrolase (decyclizing) [Pelagicoccus enzymogenes]|uniref:3D-(3,5/4)-trihydroxycyclohexane-1,2-dione acylhydrolase (decyclizing) n=1 Tax=Pelagicoccus enzymogenes TaxID=2773457 RepID=UPI00280E3632|nr:3D-(3,5/4)-trihydroxycyclohexane-1,2-dione acylhydrolase (decyclizing) [Pelagicoccus enzymogenes]MDQ8199751.1 3D-(3,5/4)-trihydroxycyclohexane-1,2-dione acylhydrolase (decyclizing) [Pelagicoccus enzymogenes]